MKRFTKFTALLLLLAAFFKSSAGAFGPETVIPGSKSLVFISGTRYEMVGLIVSKRFFITYYQLDDGDVGDFELRFGSDLSKSPLYPLGRVYFADSDDNFYVGKSCRTFAGYTPVALTPSKFPDHSKNLTGELIYFRASENKVYSRSIDILADDLCDEDSGSSIDTTYLGCIPSVNEEGNCEHFYDQFADGSRKKIRPAVVVNQQPIGMAYPKGGTCTTPDDNNTETNYFYKLTAERDSLLTVATVDIP